MSSSLALREYSYWMAHYRRTWRGTVVVSVANPLFFLAAMGAGLGRLVDHQHSPYLHGVGYLAFFAPGLLAAATMQTAVLEAGRPVHTSARKRGNYRAAAATPLRPADIFSGHLLFMAFRITVSATAFVLVLQLFPATRSVQALLLVPAALLTGLAFAAPLAAWAITVERTAALNSFFRFVAMPLYMFSGTFFSIGQLPSWLRPLAYASPLWQGVDLCRTLALSTATWAGSALHIAYLAALTCGGVIAARRTYHRHLHS
ncbi:ABC transporter permease [Streptacidiphilus cavernicola]|uniref:Transport permease protein n=1 Tax=Streptacidiphilus cavernicola TaxID=3342716 RepID=A0ABV6VZX5_9ACTN